MKDMTQGNPTQLIISFAIPMLIGNIFQQIYNVADTIIVGRFLGASALAGVGSTGTLTCFLTALVIGLCNGAGLVAAQCFGCRNTEKLKQVIVSIGTALSVFTGQNMGQNNFARIHEGLRKTLTMMMVASISIAICVLLFRYPLMKLFLDESSAGDAIQIGATYLSIIGVAYVIAGIMQSYQNVIRGSGDVNTCMVAGLTELAGRIVFAYLLSSLIGSTGIWIATPLSWSCGCVIPVIRYYSGKWKSKKLV